MDAIEVSALTKHFGKLVALNGSSFSVKEGETFGFLGPNGAGKTTIIKILTGYLQPNSGSVTVDGLDVLTHTQEVQARLGYLPENAPLYPELSVQSYLRMMANLRQVPPDEQLPRISEAVYATGLSDMLTRPIGQLSKGYRQRVGMAQVLLHSPDVLIMDEPTTGLDPQARRLLWETLRNLKKRGITIILTTHYMEEADRVAHRIAIIDHGSIVAQGTPQELKQQTNAETLEQAFLALTGTTIRDEDASNVDQMRNFAKMWTRRRR